MKFVQLLVLVCLTGGSLGCGQKGPLVMPDAQKHKRTYPTLPGAKPAPATPVPVPPAPAPTSPSTPPPADLTRPSE